MTKTITLVQAPQVPGSERDALEQHYRQSIIDPDYVLVANYEMRIDVIEKNPDDRVVVLAPGVPVTEVTALRKRVEDALDGENPEDRLVVVNYECLVFTVPQDAKSVRTYGELADPDPEDTKAGHEETEMLINGTYSELTGQNDFSELDEDEKG